MAIISGTPTSYTKPGVTVNLNINDSSTGSNEFLVLVMGNATSGTAMYGKTGPYLFTTLDQLATDFGKNSDIYTIIEQYQITDSSTSLYAINLIATDESTSTVSNGNIKSITANLNSTASTTDPAGTGIAATGGSGSGATLDVTSTPSSSKFLPASVVINNPGTGYKVGDTLTITGVGTLTVATVDETSVTGVTDDVLMEQTLATIGDIEFDLAMEHSAVRQQFRAGRHTLRKLGQPHLNSTGFISQPSRRLQLMRLSPQRLILHLRIKLWSFPAQCPCHQLV